MKKVVSFTVAGSIMLVSFAALAQVPVVVETQAAWQIIVNQVLSWMLAIAAPVVSALLITLLYKWLGKQKVEAAGITEELLSGFAQKGVDYVEQLKKNLLKAGLPPKPGSEWLATATDMVATLVEQYKLPKMASDALKKLIEAKLGETIVPSTTVVVSPSQSVVTVVPATNPVEPVVVTEPVDSGEAVKRLQG